MYTQFHGEKVNGSPKTDEILRSYFEDYSYKGTIIEVGAYDPIVLSNSYHFEKNEWDAYCIEANNIDFHKFSSRKHVFNVACSKENKDDVEFSVVTSSNWTAGFSSINVDEKLVEKYGKHNIEGIKKIKVNVRTLDYLLKNEMKEIKKIDILTIDVEGSELDVLNGFDIDRWKPRVVFIEDHFSEKDKKIYDYMTSHNYNLDKRIEYNNFYTIKDVEQ